MKGLSSLLQSRKFWLALIGFVVAAVLFVRGMITAEQLVDAIVALVMVLIGGIAIEDAALKNGVGKRG